MYGIVQGVGFRPTVDRHAHTAGVTGTVANKGPYVEIYARGSRDNIDRFLELVTHHTPSRAVILKVDVKDITDCSADMSFDNFRIVESAKTSGEIYIPPDIAICDDCKRELFDKKNRRYLHPFINCTVCGPRLTIIDALPYDRERTSMKMFPMCPSCEKEYHDLTSRRYDAQPVCCHDCGPDVYILGQEEKLRGHAAISYVRKVIAKGGIAAVKGIGGFHLCCDATNEAAVARLRRLKSRPMKPFAVMARDETVAARECEITAAQMEILTGHQKPILLLPKRHSDQTQLAATIAPDNPTVGIMLPYAPIQLLLFQYDDGIWMPDCLVMTSGNVSGAPIARTDEDAASQIAGFCDCILSNNRKIRVRADDSVMDFYDGEPYMIRRSRGYAPLPYLMSKEMQGKVLAMGGELKNTFCIGVNSLFYPSSYIGDLADVRTIEALEDSAHLMTGLLEAKPEIIACDMHPRYNATLAAEKFAKEYNIPIERVQHHYAHILSCMAENDYTDPVIGISLDGTGYGTDDTIWGGEVLASNLTGFRRTASITPFWQIGGDLSSKEGWRIAVSMLLGLEEQKPADAGNGTAMEMIRALGLCDEQTTKVQRVMYDKKLNAVQSTSAGRLFDAVAAILGIRRASTFEGEASNALMFRAMSYEAELEQSMRRSAAQAAGSTNCVMAECTDFAVAGSTGARATESADSIAVNSADLATVESANGETEEARGLETAGAMDSIAADILGAIRNAEWKRFPNLPPTQGTTNLAAPGDEDQENCDARYLMPTDLLVRLIAGARLQYLTAGQGAEKLRHPDGQPVAHFDSSDANMVENPSTLNIARETDFAASPAAVSAMETAGGGTFGADDHNARLLSYVFHKALAEMVTKAAVLERERSGVNCVALSGGCYQNRLLLRLTEERMREEGFTVLRHHLVPPNDGGIGLGQALYAMNYLEQNGESLADAGLSNGHR